VILSDGQSHARLAEPTLITPPLLLVLPLLQAIALNIVSNASKSGTSIRRTGFIEWATECGLKNGKPASTGFELNSGELSFGALSSLLSFYFSVNVQAPSQSSGGGVLSQC